jgi:membrane protease YdiL (CAAX protease family)
VVAILTVWCTLSILADSAIDAVPTSGPITVTPVAGPMALVPWIVVLLVLCVLSAYVCVSYRLVEPRSTPDSAEPSHTVDAYRLAMILFASLVLMTTLPSIVLQVIGSTDVRSLQFVGVITRAIVLGAALAATAGLVKGGWSAIGMTMTKLASCWQGVAALVLAVPWIYAALLLTQFIQRVTGISVEQQTHETLTLIRTNVDPVAVAMATFGAVVLAPVMEEVLFRGLLQTALSRLITKPWLAIGLTSVFFAIIHPPFSIPAIFVLSVAIGILYHRTQSLWAAIAFHVAFNAVNTGLTLLMR